jgi:hypothetical protein
MFEFFFKYLLAVFTKGKFVLLGAWHGWLLLLLIAACMAGLALLIRSRLPQAAAKISRWRAGTVWLLQSLLIATVLVLLWQPAVTVAELAPFYWMIRAAWRLPTAGPTVSFHARPRRKRRLRVGCWQGCKRSFKLGSTGWTLE